MAQSTKPTASPKDADFSFFANRLKQIKEGKSAINEYIFKLDRPERKNDVNSAVVRILPYKFAERSLPFIEAFFHYNVGSQTSVACPKHNFQEECSLCSHVDKLYNEAKRIGKKAKIDTYNRDAMRNNSEIAALWNQAGDLKAKKRVYTPVIVVSVNGKEATEEQKGIKFFGMSPSLFDNQVIPALSKPRKINPLDRYNGFPFRFSMSNDGTTYGKTGFEVLSEEEDPSAILSDKSPEEIDAFVETVPNIWEVLLKQRSPEEVADLLAEILDDEESVDIASSSTPFLSGSVSQQGITEELTNEISDSLEEAVEDIEDLL